MYKTTVASETEWCPEHLMAGIIKLVHLQVDVILSEIISVNIRRKNISDLFRYLAKYFYQQISRAEPPWYGTEIKLCICPSLIIWKSSRYVDRCSQARTAEASGIRENSITYPGTVVQLGGEAMAEFKEFQVHDANENFY